MKKLLLIVSLTLSLGLAGESVAFRPVVSLDTTTPGPTPFISFVGLRISDPAHLSSVSFSIKPKSGSKTRPIAATYSVSYLQKAGYFRPGSMKVNLPVFGLYQGRQNTVAISSSFTDGTTLQTRVNITTEAYVDGTFTSPTIVQPRSTTTTLSYDFILMKASTTDDTPVIIDSDAEVRWVGSAGRGGQQSILYQNGIYTTNGLTSLVRLEFDGRSTTLADYAGLGVTGMHHNFDYGRDGILIDVDTADWVESVNMEVDGQGNVLHTWNLADIVSAAMVAGGDDPAQFVFPAPSDWFHNNATTYRPSDNSFVVSSRENFVIALDYDTQAIKWILGATDKHWYEFRSLRKFALRLGTDTLAPVGQHAISFFDDNLLLFDNGTASLTQMPTGMGRTYSAPRKYSINGNKATEIFHYLADPAIKDSFCGSVYEDSTDNYLIDYAMDNGVNCDIVGLDDTGAVAFFYQYVADGCGTAFNANPLHLENLQFN